MIDENSFDTEDFDDGMPWGTDKTEAALPEVDVEEQPAEEPDEATAEETEEEESPERPRNEKGQFVSQQEDTEVDPDAVEAARERHGDEDPEKLLKIIADMTQHTRNQQSQLDQMMHLQQQQMQSQQPEYDYDEIAESDPKSATMLAWQTGNEAAFNQSWNAWAEEDPAQAALWVSDQRHELLRQEVMAQTQPLVQHNTTQQRNSALAEFGKEHTDIGEYVEGINQFLDENPPLKVLAEQGLPQFQVQALKAAYDVAKARKTATLRSASQVAGQANAAATEAALSEAFVASASNSVVQTAEPSTADRLAEDWGVSGLYWDPKP